MYMKKHLLIIILLLILISSKTTSQNIGEIFVDAPQQITPTLTHTEKLELWAYYKSQKRDTLQNRFGTTIKLLTIDTINNHIQLQTSDISYIEIITFNSTDNTKIIGVIHTVCTPTCSSYANFYDKEWKEIDTQIPNFTSKKWKTNPPYQNTQPTPKTDFIQLQFDAKQRKLLFINNSLQLVNTAEINVQKKQYEDQPISIPLEKLFTKK